MVNSYGPSFVNDLKEVSTASQSFTSASENHPWVEVKLKVAQEFTGVEFVNRGDGNFASHLKKVEVRAGLESVPEGFAGAMLTINDKVGSYDGPAGSKEKVQVMFDSGPVVAQYLTLQLEGTSSHLCLNEIYIVKDCSSPTKSVTFWNGHMNYPATNVLTEEVDNNAAGSRNYWVPHAHKTGGHSDGAYFLMDLGCPQTITAFQIKNAGNLGGNNAGVKRMSISTSDDGSAPWTNQYAADIQDVRPKRNAPETITTGVYPLQTPLQDVQYLKFIVQEYWGVRGALQYFDVINAGENN